MTTMLVILEPRAVRITAEGDVSHRCPINGSIDQDHYLITYDGSDGVIEAASLADYMRTFENVSVTSEALAESIQRELVAIIPSVSTSLIGPHAHGRVTLTVVAT